MTATLTETLLDQHRRVVALLDEEDCVAELARDLTAHLRAEEEQAYPAGEQSLASAVAIEEHIVIAVIARRLVNSDAQTAHARRRLLRILVVHHFDAEERCAFPQLERRLGRARSLRAGAEVKTRFDELRLRRGSRRTTASRPSRERDRSRPKGARVTLK